MNLFIIFSLDKMPPLAKGRVMARWLVELICEIAVKLSLLPFKSKAKYQKEHYKCNFAFFADVKVSQVALTIPLLQKMVYSFTSSPFNFSTMCCTNVICVRECRQSRERQLCIERT